MIALSRDVVLIIKGCGDSEMAIRSLLHLLILCRVSESLELVKIIHYDVFNDLLDGLIR